MSADSPNTLSGAKLPDPVGLAGCRIEARIALGNGARVYRAVDVGESRTVALKILTVPLVDDVDVVDRFLVAASALVGLKHDNVVEVLRAGRDGHTPYAVLEHVEGEDLERQLTRERTLSPPTALSAVIDACRGLQAALGRGVRHGDLRPAHLLATRAGPVKLTGFGLSPPFTTAHGRTLSGSPAYLAPETVVGDPVDHRADIYALGCTLYELLVGRPPFGFGGPDALVACHVHETFPALRPHCPRAPEELERLLYRMVAKRADARIATYDELIAAAEEILPAVRAAAPRAPALIVESGRQLGLRIEVPEGELLLGRSPGEGVQLDDGRVSRRHALLRRAGDYVEVVDLESRNGIRVNHIEVRSRQLFHEDRLGIGDTILRVEAPALASGQLPAQLQALPASPVRGAFGDVELSHAPARQARAEDLWPCPDPHALGDRLHLLARRAPLFAAAKEGPGAMKSTVLRALDETLRPDARLWVAIEDGKPVLDAATATDAELLSCTMPALERALPGRLSLATTVKVDREGMWSVLLCPVHRRESVLAYVVLVKKDGRFTDQGLLLLEAACGLLSTRAEAALPAEFE